MQDGKKLHHSRLLHAWLRLYTERVLDIDKIGEKID